VLLALKLWLHRATRFVEQYADEAPACCGTCKTCVSATTAAAVTVVFGSIRRGELRAARSADRR
jgi:hypothetical protein